MMEENTGGIGPGTALGPFEIERVLGKGGMGVVYKAHEPSLNRKVALKVLSDMLSSNEEYITRFKKEAQIVAALNHPNIVRILSFGEDLGHYFFAMEYIKGKDLGQILREKTVVPVNEALSIVRQIAEALSEAGKKGVVHRDLKPSNIMIDEMDRVRVTDFGVARFEGATEGLTQTGMFLGTPEYASPEQATGKSIDTRSDIYSVGALLYRMLSGKPPIVGDSPLAVVAKIATEPVTPIGLINPAIPAPVSALIEKLMAKEVHQRFQTPDEVCAAIDECEKRLGVAPDGLSPEETKEAASPRDRLKTAYLLVSSVLVVVALAGTLFLTRDRWTHLLKASATATPEMTSREDVPGAPDMEAATGIPETEMAPRGVLSASFASTTSEYGMPETQTAEDRPALHSGSSMTPPLPETVMQTAAVVPVQTPTETLGTLPASDSSRMTVNHMPVRLPETPTVLMMVSGPDEMMLLMRPYLESSVLDSGLRVLLPADVPLLREKIQMGDIPVSWYDIRQFIPGGRADILVLATIKEAGTRMLEFYGRSQEQTTAMYSIRTLDMDSGEAVGRSKTGQVKYTALNMEDQFRGALEAAATGLGDAISEYWRAKRGPGEVVGDFGIPGAS